MGYAKQQVKLFLNEVKTTKDASLCYEKMVRLFRRVIFKVGSYASISKASISGVMETVKDLYCMAIIARTKGTVTGNTKEIKKVQEKIEKWEEERKGRVKPATVVAGMSREKTEQEKKEIKEKIKRLYQHATV